MLQQLELTSLSQHHKFLKLTTMYNNGTLYFPTGYFVQNYFPYSSSHGTLNYIRPFARTICIHHLSNPLLPRARMREGVKQSVFSVCLSVCPSVRPSVCPVKNFEI